MVINRGKDLLPLAKMRGEKGTSVLLTVLKADTGGVIVEIQEGAKKVVDAVGQFSSQLSH